MVRDESAFFADLIRTAENPGRAMGTTGKINTARLADIVGPRSVAVVGASEDLGKFGGRALHHLIKHGFQGRIVPINPKRPNLFGLPAAPTIVAAGPVDVALIALPADQLVSCIEDCATAGVRAAVIITAQMAEVGGEGAARQQRIVEIARASRMRIVGPNCLGLVNTRARLALTASFAMGALWDTAFGPFVLVGSGGIFAELFEDTSLAPAPVTREGAVALLEGLKIWPVLQGARGRAKTDVAAAIDAVVAIGWLAAELGPQLLELDINPLILRAEGKGAIAVDARARLEAQGDSDERRNI